MSPAPMASSATMRRAVPQPRWRAMIALALTAVYLGACAHAPHKRAEAPDAGTLGLDALTSPECGARIYVAMGINQKYPTRADMRIPRGDLYLNGNLVDRVSKNPEISVLDVSAGRSELSWIPTGYGRFERSKTTQDSLVLDLTEHQTAFVVLDWYDDTPDGIVPSLNPDDVAFRTEVVKSDKQPFEGKRIAFHLPPEKPCASTVIAAASPAASSPATSPAPPPSPLDQSALLDPGRYYPNLAPKKPPPITVILPEDKPAAVPPQRQPAHEANATPPPTAAKPQPQQMASAIPAPPAQASESSAAAAEQLPETEDAALSSAHWYYIVNARDGAPAFAAPSAAGAPLYTFSDGTELKVLEVSADKRWLKVQIPHGRKGYVSTAIVTTGFRLPK